MSHPLSVTVGESQVIERAFSAAGVTCHIYPDPEDAGRVVFKRLVGACGEVVAGVRSYAEDGYGFRFFVQGLNGVDSLLQALRWFYAELYNSEVATIVVAATRAALDAHTLIADADRREDSINSSDAIDRCYAAVRVVLPEYTTSSDIEPPTPQE